MEKQSTETTESPGTAIPLITIVNKKFVLSKEAIEVLNNDQNKAIGIISLVGKYRTGKSFLLNRVLLNNNLTEKSFGFSVGPTIKPCTKGIWMWSQPMKVTNNHYGENFNVFFIDTEGLGAYDEEVNHDSKIFLIAMLISSLFLLNSFSSIDENSINNLSLILNLSQTIKLSKDDDKTNPEDLARFFPSLLWLLRDFSLKLEDPDGNTITAKQYLESALALVKGSATSIEEKNRVRKMVKLYFQERDCYTMVRPVESEEHLQNLNSLPDNLFRPEFLTQCDALRNKIFKKVKPKIFNGKVLSGKMTVNLLTSILDSLNQGTIPVIESTWNYIVSAEGTKHFEQLVKEYTDGISAFFGKIKSMESNDLLTYDFNSELSSYNKNLQSQVTDKFETIMRSIDENNFSSMVDKFKQKLISNFKDLNESHQKLFKEKFNEILSTQYSQIEKKIVEKAYFSQDSKLDKPNSSGNNDITQYNSILSPNVNYHQFFQDIENIKDLLETSTPAFNSRDDEIHYKQTSIIKYFIEESFIKEKSYKDLEIIRLINEKGSTDKKFSSLNEDIFELKSELKAEKERFQTETLELKSDLRGKNEVISNMENERRKRSEANDQNLQKTVKDYTETNEKLEKKIRVLEEDLKMKDNQVLTMKFNEEKMSALNSQKSEFLEKEIESLKEKVGMYSKMNEELKTTAEDLNSTIEELKSENANLNLAKSQSQPIREESGEVSEFTLKEKQTQIDSLKIQLEETKKIYEDVIENLKFSMNKEKENISKDNETETSKETDNNNGAAASNQDYKEIIESNKNLSLALANYEKRCSKLEEKIESYKQIKNILLTGAGIQCKTCSKVFSYEIYKKHYEECKVDLISGNKESNDQADSSKNENFKIKILKGIICQDESFKPYIEYILEISFNLQVWRLNKKFNQFVNFHRALSKTFSQLMFPESSSIFFVSEISNNFHENKIKGLEKYLKDLCSIDCVINSQLFRKFIGFQSHFDNLDLNQEGSDGINKPEAKLSTKSVKYKESNIEEKDFYSVSNATHSNAYSKGRNSKKSKSPSPRQMPEFIGENTEDDVKDLREELRDVRIEDKSKGNKFGNYVNVGKNTNSNNNNNNNTKGKLPSNITPVTNPTTKGNLISLGGNSGGVKQSKIGSNKEAQQINLGLGMQHNQGTNYISTVKTNDPNVIIDKLNVKKKPINKTLTKK